MLFVVTEIGKVVFPGDFEHLTASVLVASAQGDDLVQCLSFAGRHLVANSGGDAIEGPIRQHEPGVAVDFHNARRRTASDA